MQAQQGLGLTPPAKIFLAERHPIFNDLSQ